MGSFFLTGHIWHIGGEGRGAAGSVTSSGWVVLLFSYTTPITSHPSRVSQ